MKDVKNTRAMRGPDCQTDHYLIRTTLNFSIKPAYSKSKPARKRKLDVAQLKNVSRQANLQAAITSALNENPAEEETPDCLWNTMSKTVFDAAADALGYTNKRNADWFNENDSEIRNLITERNASLRIKRSNPSATNQQRLKAARATLQLQLREIENDWWLQKAEKMQKGYICMLC